MTNTLGFIPVRESGRLHCFNLGWMFPAVCHAWVLGARVRWPRWRRRGWWVCHHAHIADQRGPTAARTRRNRNRDDCESWLGAGRPQVLASFRDFRRGACVVVDHPTDRWFWELSHLSYAHERFCIYSSSLGKCLLVRKFSYCLLPTYKYKTTVIQ